MARSRQGIGVAEFVGIPLAVVSESIGEDSNGGAQFWRGDR
jgi:hypothetical protein